MKKKESKINVLLIEGVAIFLIMFIHSGTPDSIYAFLSYGLSCLIFARGYQWRDKSFKELINSRIQLLETYYFAGLINTVIFILVVPREFLTTSKWNYFLNFAFGKLSDLNQVPLTMIPLWFLLMLFFAELIYWLVRKNKIILWASVAFSIFLRTVPHTILPFELSAAFSALPFFVMGRAWKEKGYKVKFIDFALAVAGLVLISQTNGDVSWNSQSFGKNGLISFLGEILGTIMIIYLSELTKMIKIDKFFYKIAFNSLFIISYHYLLGTLLYFPFNILFGGIDDPVALLHNLWYIHFPIVLLLVFTCIKFIPQKAKKFLVGDFKHFSKT